MCQSIYKGNEEKCRAEEGVSEGVERRCAWLHDLGGKEGQRNVITLLV